MRKRYRVPAVGPEKQVQAELVPALVVPVADAPLPLPPPDNLVEAWSSPERGEPPALVAIPLTAWRICGAAVTGLAHHRRGLPCQDAVASRDVPRPIFVLSDGAGSAAISERGAATLVVGAARFLTSMEDALAPWLDGADGDEPRQTEIWSRRLLAHARGLLDDLAQSERRDVADLRATLLVAVIGTIRTFWWRVGDGALAIRHAAGLRVLGDTGSTKGEFANQTCFVDNASSADVQCDLLHTADIFGLALMSDGGAERLVAHDGSRVAVRLGEWFDAVARQEFSPDRIALAFHEPAMWERTSLDDRAIVLAARAGAQAMPEQIS